MYPIINCACKSIQLTLCTDCFNHRSSKCKIIIKDLILCECLSENDFKTYFMTANDFEATFDKPELFERNFEYYINNYKGKKFKLINDDKRKDFIDEILDYKKYIFNYTSYFGQSGIGKTISIIRISKNLINHEKYGTLYINCKCLYKFIKEYKYAQFKSILINEIPYLFYNEYSNYYNCVKLIYNHNISDKKDYLWKLIEEIIKYVLKILNIKQSEPKNYIFFFDQYNNEIDPNNYLKTFYDRYILKKEKKLNGIGFISVCSMNNDDIKEYIFKKLKDELEPTYKNDFLSIKEIDNLIDFETLKFENEDKDEYLNLLGRNIKNFNILNNYKKEFELRNYFQGKKYNIENKIKDYYQYKSNNLNLLKLLSFSTESKYNINEFEKIYKYIPFKYFYPKKCKEIYKCEKRKFISINYAFPLVEQAIGDILAQAISEDLNIYKTLIENYEFDIFGREYLFEKLIAYYLGTNKNNNNKFFEDINIDKIISIDKFIPRKNEKVKKPKKKISLGDGTYLFTQKHINENDLDLLIITIKYNTADIISKIYNDKYLQDIYTKLNQNLSFYYNFIMSKFRFSFIYIFDLSYENFNYKEFISMTEKCKSDKINYLLFDVYNIEFLNSDKNKVKFLIFSIKNKYFYFTI